MSLIRVLHIVPNMHAAGLETLIMNLYRNIDRSKIQFDFLVHYEERCFYDDEIEALGGKIYRLSLRNDGNILKYIKDLNEFFSNHKYDIVHGHMASTAAFYLGAAKKHGVPIRIIHSHNTSTEKTFKGFIKQYMLKFSTIFANEYFACGKMAGAYLYKNKPFTVIHNAIDLNKFNFNADLRDQMRAQYGLTDNFVIGHIGRFNTQKNHKFLIKIFEKFYSEVPNSRLILVGEGELENEIKDYVRSKGLEKAVIFTGVISDTNAIYNMLDVFVLPSLFEGLPVVGVESQASGCVTLMSDKITKEIKLSNLVSFLTIDDINSLDQWCVKLKDIMKEQIIDSDRFVHCDLIKNGYDIKEESIRLMEKYNILLQEKDVKF